MNQLSFRDPDGFLIKFESKLFRVLLEGWKDELVYLNESLFIDYSIPNHISINEFVYNRILKELEIIGLDSSKVLTILEVEELPLITYPWEWTPTMLIDAGIFSLEFQRKLMSYGLSLKDASFFNIQFVSNQILFIDLLSIKKTTHYYPWIPYGQFLRHFIYPATLLRYGKIQNLKLLWNFLDGIDFEYTYKAIPTRSIFNLFEFFHYYIAAFLIKKKSFQPVIFLASDLDSKIKLNNLINWNIGYLKRIKASLLKRNSYWMEYYTRDVPLEYSQQKTKAIKQLMDNILPEGRILDIGSNTGEYSYLFMNYFNVLICLEKDPVCCEAVRNRLAEQSHIMKGKSWYVINSDIVNPDPALGWMNIERTPLISRIKSTLVSALGISHHIYFTESINFIQQVNLFYCLTLKYLMIEFISANDEKVKIISLNNQTRLTEYSRNNFLKAYSLKFKLLENIEINSTRELFLFERLIINEIHK